MRNRRTRIGILLAVLALVLAACGGGDGNSSDNGAGGGNGGDTGGDSGGGSDANGSGGLSSGDTGVTVTLDGTQYVVDTSLGGRCTIGGDEIAASGYDVDTGKRVEISFSRQDAEFSPTGQDAYYGGLFVALDEGGDWQIDSDARWDWWTDGASAVSGAVTMEDYDGQTADISFEIDCP